MKSAFDACILEFLEILRATSMEVLSISEEVMEKKDASGAKTGERARFVKVGVEIPKGNGPLSRIRFEVKIPDGLVRLTTEDLENKEYLVEFAELNVSYVDGSRRAMYFRAEDYRVQEVQ